MKRITMILLSLLLLTGCTVKQESYMQISQEEALELMKTEHNYVILDVRTDGEFGEGHLPGAVNIPLDTIESQAAALLPRKDQLILVYCRSGNRSKKASRMLADLGYSNIKEFGGINTWQGEIEK